VAVSEAYEKTGELENLRDHYVHLKKKRRSTSGSGASISLKPENLLSEHIIERNHKTKGMRIYLWKFIQSVQGVFLVRIP
jgi:hypothetical protein